MWDSVFSLNGQEEALAFVQRVAESASTTPVAFAERGRWQKVVMVRAFAVIRVVRAAVIVMITEKSVEQAARGMVGALRSGWSGFESATTAVAKLTLDLLDRFRQACMRTNHASCYDQEPFT